MIPTLPARWYDDPTIFARERAAIFDQTWLLAGHVTTLPSPTGAQALRVGGRSILLVRRADGTLGAFHNVCRHRAAPLLWEGSSQRCATLQCRYHGWRYDLDGTLRSTSGFGETFSPDDWGLLEVHLRQWRGLLFVCFLPIQTPPPPLSEAISGLQTVAAELPLESMVAFDTRSHTLRCNWKTYVENYLEGYHIPWLHPTLSAEISMRDYRVTVTGRTALHVVPTKAGAISQGMWAWQWPNVALNVYGTGMSIERMNPVSPVEMEIHYTYLSTADSTPAEREQSVAMSEQVTAEDVQICEAVAANLSAGTYQTGRLSPRHEGGVAAFQDWVRQALDA